MGGQKIGILEVAVIKGRKFVRPCFHFLWAGTLHQICVFVLDRLTENGDLFDESLQREGMSGLA